MNFTGNVQTRPLPSCPSHKWETPIPLNESLPTNLYKAQKLLSINTIDMGIPPIPPMVPYFNLKLDEDNSHRSWHSFFSRDTSSRYGEGSFGWRFLPVNATSLGLIVFFLLLLYLMNRKIIRIGWLGRRVLSKTGQTIKRRKKGTAIKRWLLQKIPARLSSV